MFELGQIFASQARRFALLTGLAVLLGLMAGPLKILEAEAASSNAGTGVVVPAWGTGSQASQDSSKMKSLFSAMHYRGLTSLRMQFNLTKDTDSYEVGMFSAILAQAKLYNVKIKPLLFVAFSWDDRTDAGLYPAGDANALYQQGFNRTYNFVLNFKDVVNDWELQNEVNMKNLVNGKSLWGDGWTAAEFNTPLMNDWAAVLKGMSDAIALINQQYGLHLRRTFGTSASLFGFLDFMASKNVGFDLISYHYYGKLSDNPNNYWGGSQPYFNIFQKLGTYNRNVEFNEINCAEIYQSGFENKARQPLTETCYKSLFGILGYLSAQQYINIEDINIYEMYDEPSKAAPENHFGLLYDVGMPKVSMFILSMFAGGQLASGEKTQLINRGFMARP